MLFFWSSLPCHPDPAPRGLFIWNVYGVAKNINATIGMGWIEYRGTGLFPLLPFLLPVSSLHFCSSNPSWLDETQPLGKSGPLRLMMWLCPEGCGSLAFFFPDWSEDFSHLSPGLSPSSLSRWLCDASEPRQLSLAFFLWTSARTAQPRVVWSLP